MTKSKKKTKSPKPKSPELQAFVKHSSQLHGALNGGILIRLAWDLHQGGILSRSAVETITHEMLSDSKQASKLVNVLERSISTEFLYFDIICDSCSKYIELESTIDRMKRTCINLRKAETITLSVPDHNEKEASKSVTTCGFTNTVWCVIVVLVLLLLFSGVFFLGVRFGSVTTPYHYEYPSKEHYRSMSQVNIQPSRQIGYGALNYSNSKFPLPSPPEPFVGRSNEMKQVLSNLSNDEISIVGLFGPPAFGKTSLAIHVGHCLLQNHTPVNDIDLSEFGISFEQTSNYVRPRSEVQPHRLETTSTVTKMKKTVNVAHLISWAENILSPTVLILDNCDIVLNQCQDKFQEFIGDLVKSSSRRLTILITSQVRISFLDHFSSYGISELPLRDSYSLIAKLNPTISKEIQAEIAEHVGNCPLAIKVIVMLLKQPQSLSPADIVKQLKRNTLEVENFQKKTGSLL